MSQEIKKVAINGLGRIGRLLLRSLWSEQSSAAFEIVAVNDLVDGGNLAYLMKYDSVHGRLRDSVAFKDDTLTIGDHQLKLFHEKDPENLPWAELGVDLVIECTGLFTDHAGASKHLRAGAKKVIVSAPSETADITVVMGVNDQQYQPDLHHIVSNASCTTNSLAPPLKVLLDNFGVESVLVTTVHGYTVSQGIVDKPSKKNIRGRAAAVNIIPTGTGADKATVLVLPELAGKIAATALRVPVPDGAITDISVELSTSVTAEMVNDAFSKAAANEMSGVLDFTMEEIVSTDILGDPHSAIVHGLTTRVVNGTSVKLHVWYDNEYGYASRLVDLANLML